jgi:hypothetical protein
MPPTPTTQTPADDVDSRDSHSADFWFIKPLSMSNRGPSPYQQQDSLLPLLHVVEENADLGLC